MSMQLSPFQIARRFAGRFIPGILVAGFLTGTLSAHAGAVTAGPTYAVSMVLEAGGEKSAPRVLATAGEQFAVASGVWRVELTVRQGKTPAEVWLISKVFKGSTIVSTPTLMAHVKEETVIKVGENSEPFSLSMVVSPRP